MVPSVFEALNQAWGFPNSERPPSPWNWGAERPPRTPGLGGCSLTRSGQGRQARERGESAEPRAGKGLLAMPRQVTTTRDLTTMASSGISLPGQSTVAHSSLGFPGGGADAGTRAPHHRAGSEQAAGKDAWEQMEYRAALCGAFPSVLGLGTCRLQKLRAPAGRIPTVACAWKFMQEKPGRETDCLHLFLKEPSSGPIKIFAQGPLECQV